MVDADARHEIKIEGLVSLKPAPVAAHEVPRCGPHWQVEMKVSVVHQPAVRKVSSELKGG